MADFLNFVYINWTTDNGNAQRNIGIVNQKLSLSCGLVVK